MTNRPLRDDERADIARIQQSLYDWAFGDIKRATYEAVIPALAFIGLASWVDAVARLYTGKRKNGEGAWKEFIRAYLPTELHTDEAVGLLYDGLRCAISHEYGTRGFALTHQHAELHWQVVDGIRLVNLESLVELFERAYEQFYSDLHEDADLRDRVLPVSMGLLGPVTIEVPQRAEARNLLATASLSASATAPATTIRPV